MATKKMLLKKRAPRPAPKTVTPELVNDSPPEEGDPVVVDVYDAALARAKAVLAGAQPPDVGTILERRQSHEERWAELIESDHRAREQILTLKARENEVLGLIRDKMAGNLMDTIDSAVTQGLLNGVAEA